MALPTLRVEQGFDFLWEELVYSEIRLETHPLTKHLAPLMQELENKLHDLRRGQLGKQKGEIRAQVMVDNSDDDLDDFVDDLDFEIGKLDRHDDTRYDRYFKESPSAIQRLALQSELPKVKGWVSSLQGEAEAELKKLGKQLSGIVAKGQAALDGRIEAAAAKTDYRTREILPFVEDINATRYAVYRQLMEIAEKNQLSRRFPDRFFRHATRTPARKSKVKAGIDPVIKSS